MLKLPFVFAVVAGLAANAPNVPIPTQPPAKSQGAEAQSKGSQTIGAQDERGTEKVPLVVKITAPPHDDRIAAEDKQERKQQAVTEKDLADYTLYLVIATAILAGIAFAQAGLFVWQLIYMRRGLQDTADAARSAAVQTELARKTYVASNRPQLRIRRLSIDKPVPGQMLTVRFEVINVGGTKATVISTEITIRITDMMAGWIMYHGGSRELERTRMIPFTREIQQGEALLAEGQVTNFDPNWGFGEGWWDGRLFVIGVIRYMDDNGVTRLTAFYRKATQDKNRFVKPDFEPTTAADHEYED